MATEAPSENVWSEQDTKPTAVEAALRRLLAERHAEDEGFAPARVCNLIAIVDADWRGEIENRLERVGRFHPSLTVVWSPHGHDSAVDALLGMAEVVLIDSVASPDPRAAVSRANWLAEQAYV